MILASEIVFATGCTTNFSNPIRSYANKYPTIHIVQQGSIPATSAYRDKFYFMASTNASSRAFFTPEIVAQIIAGGYTVITDVSNASSEKYYDALKTNYRWRNDVFISGFDKLSDEQIMDIINRAMQPQVDAQRSPFITK